MVEEERGWLMVGVEEDDGIGVDRKKNGNKRGRINKVQSRGQWLKPSTWLSEVLTFPAP